MSLRSLRVGRIPYLNALPFRASGKGAGLRSGAGLRNGAGSGGDEPLWTTAPPRRLGQLTARGVLDAALLASRDALALEPAFVPLGDLGIASSGPVASVLLFSERPLATLGAARVALTGESRTSRALLRLLLRGPLGIGEPTFVEESEPAEARLLIGDRALAARAAARTPYLLDLGEAWQRWTGLPFVWARWVVRRGVGADAARALEARLGAALRTPPRLPRVLPAGVDRAAARAYLARFTYQLGPAEKAGLERFAKELADHDLLQHPARGSHPGPKAGRRACPRAPA